MIRAERIVMGLAFIWDGLVTVLTLGSVVPSTAMKLAGVIMRKRIARKRIAEARELST
jgi:hypothetical protein